MTGPDYHALTLADRRSKGLPDYVVDADVLRRIATIILTASARDEGAQVGASDDVPASASAAASAAKEVSTWSPS
jgi:hypothetical protein